MMDINRYNIFYNAGDACLTVQDDTNGGWADYSDVEILIKERDEALAKLATMESQEPICQIHDAGFVSIKDACKLVKLPVGTRLYAKPLPAEPAVSVPDNWREAIYKVRDQIAHSPIDCLGTGYSNNPDDCQPWSIRDEVVNELTVLLSAPSHSQKSAGITFPCVVSGRCRFGTGLDHICHYSPTCRTWHKTRAIAELRAERKNPACTCDRMFGVEEAENGAACSSCTDMGFGINDRCPSHESERSPVTNGE